MAGSLLLAVGCSTQGGDAPEDTDTTGTTSEVFTAASDSDGARPTTIDATTVSAPDDDTDTDDDADSSGTDSSDDGGSSGAPACIDCPGACDERGYCTGGPEGGPIFLSVTTDAAYLPVEAYWVSYEEAQVGITIIVTDPDGIADLVGGTYRLLDSELTVGPLASAAEEGAYFALLHWDDVALTGLETGPGGGDVVVRISMFDQDGHESVYDLPILVACGSPGAEPWPTWGVCGSCTDLATNGASCGACGHDCTEAHAAPPGLDAADVAVGGWCEEFGCNAVVGRRGNGLDVDATPDCEALCAEHGLSCLDTAPQGDWGGFFNGNSAYGYFPDAESPLGANLSWVVESEATACAGSPACFLYDCFDVGVWGASCDQPFATLACGSLFGDPTTPVDTVLCSCG